MSQGLFLFMLLISHSQHLSAGRFFSIVRIGAFLSLFSMVSSQASSFVSKSTLREFILITLSHAERRSLVPDSICLRLRELFACLSIVISKEFHADNSFHFHVGLNSKNASKNTCTRLIRATFPEFSGSQCNVKFHKGWGSIIGYITKEDASPYVWGIYSLEEILSIGTTARQKKKARVKSTEVVLDHLRGCDDWLEVYRSPEVRERLLYGSYSNLKSVFDDVRVLKEIELSSFEKIDNYLKAKEAGGVSILEYSPEDLGEKYLLLDWIAVNLSFPRPIKTKQLHLYGPPSTQKTLILHCLSKVIRIYFASSRSNDFTGADDHYDLWVYDEFHQSEDDPFSYSSSSTDSSNASFNTLLKVLDGQECRLDAKYSRVFRKRKNVPIIIISNSVSPKARRPGPFQARFMRLKFVTNLSDLCEDRFIATLRGCILRRLGLSSLPNKSPSLSFSPLSYNLDRLDVSLDSVLNCSENSPLFSRTDKGELIKLELHQAVVKKLTYPFLRLKLPFSSQVPNRISALGFSVVPLQKKFDSEVSCPYSFPLPVFFSLRIGNNFRIVRSGSSDSFDYLFWPVRASFQDAKRVWPVEVVFVDPSEFSTVPPLSVDPSVLSSSSFFSKDIMKRPGSYLQLTVGPVSDKNLKFSNAVEWDDDCWSDAD